MAKINKIKEVSFDIIEMALELSSKNEIFKKYLDTCNVSFNEVKGRGVKDNKTSGLIISLTDNDSGEEKIIEINPVTKKNCYDSYKKRDNYIQQSLNTVSNKKVKKNINFEELSEYYKSQEGKTVSNIEVLAKEVLL